MHFIFQSDHKTLLSTFTLLQPSPGSPELWLESSPCFSCCCCSNSPLSCLILGSSLDHAEKGPVCHLTQRTATRDQLALLCAHCRCPSQLQTGPRLELQHSVSLCLNPLLNTAQAETRRKIFVEERLLWRSGLWLRTQCCRCDHSRQNEVWFYRVA